MKKFVNYFVEIEHRSLVRSNSYLLLLLLLLFIIIVINCY